MRKLLWPCLLGTLGSAAWVSESSACWWRRHAGCRHAYASTCAQPVTYPMFASAAPAPAAWAVTASPQVPSPPAQPLAAARTFIFKGEPYAAVPTNERGESEEKALREFSLAGAHAPPNDGEHFAGSARKSAKTSFASAPDESFTSPGALLDSLLKGSSPAKNDADLRGTLNKNSPRAPEERRNVTVTAFLYATKKETDNDFHLLIGDDPNGGDGRYMTAEVSGLPNPDDSLTPLFQQVRDQYKAFFAETGQPLPGDRYVRFPQPVPVTVSGSVFFDVDHTRGEVRSGNIVPETVWEIHPIRSISFGPSGGQ